MIFSLLFTPGLGSSGHGWSETHVADAYHHIAFETGEAHSHDEDDPDAADLDHQHDHHPADHSHQVGLVPQASVDAAAPSSATWLARRLDFAPLAPGYGIERPPKPVLLS